MLPLPEKALLVDDQHEKVRPALEAALHPLGTRLDFAGSEAEVEALGGGWDLIILDYWLGSVRASDLLKRLRAEMPTATILLYSGQANAFSHREAQEPRAAGFLDPDFLADPDLARDYISTAHAAFQLSLRPPGTQQPLFREGQPLVETGVVAELIRRAREDYRPRLGGHTDAVLAALPDLVFGKASLGGKEADGEQVLVSGETPLVEGPCTAAIFHGISPWGETAALLGSLGRDWRVAEALGVPHRVVFVQGLALARLNRSIAAGLSGGLTRATWSLQVRRRRRLYAAVGFDSRVIDLECGGGADFITDLSFWVRLAKLALDGAGRGATGADLRKRLKAIDESRQAELLAGIRSDYLLLGLTDDAARDQFRKVLAVLGDALNLDGSLEDATLPYFLRAAKLLDSLAGPLLRLGPLTERYFDGHAHRQRQKAKDADALKSDPGRAEFAALYFRNYRIGGAASLPYCLLSDELFGTSLESAAQSQILISSDADARQVHLRMARTPWLELCRFLADLLSFSAKAVGTKAFDRASADEIEKKLAPAVDPKLAAAHRLASTQRLEKIAQRWVEKGGEGTVPLQFLPYLIGSTKLYSLEMAELVAAVSRFAGRLMDSEPASVPGPPSP